MSLNADSTEMVKIAQAFYMFLNEKVLPFYKKLGINQFSFRDNKLHQQDIEVVFTMNDRALRQIYDTQTRKNRDTKFKPHNGDWMILIDAFSLFREDTTLYLPFKMINEAFGMSQPSYVNEFDKGSLGEYNKLSYVEYLEFLARIAELYFEGSEMEELELSVKLEYLLDELLPLV